MDPKVSVIIPVYNAAEYLRECLDSAVSQTVTDIEIICVDDGSDDGSMEILREYSARDARITVLEQQHRFAGEARNKGMDAAKGEYLYFMDADDKMLPAHLAEVIGEAEKTKADIVLTQRCGWRGGNERSDIENHIRAQGLIFERVISWQTHSKYLLNCCDGAPGGKLFRAAFVRKYALRFPALPRSEDLVFVYGAIVRADRICLSDKKGYLYRLNNQGSLEATKDQTPTAFWKAQMLLKADLQTLPYCEKLHQSFVNNAVNHFVYNFNAIKTGAGWEAVYRLFKEVRDSELELYAHEDAWFYNPTEVKTLREIDSADSALGYLYRKYRGLQEAVADEREEVLNSTTFKVGKSVMFIPQIIKKCIKYLLRK